MRSEDCRRVLDFFFSGVEVSEELKQKYLGWLSAYGDEPEVKALLEEYWESVSSDCPEFDLAEGLDRLMETIGGNPSANPSADVPEKTPERTGVRRIGRIFRYCSVAAAAVALFVAGAATAKFAFAPEKETVLVASSDNACSYTLPDGTDVWLNRDARLSYNQDFGKGRREVKIDGEGYFEVVRNEDCPFIVTMHDNLRLKVLGTTFNVRSDRDDHCAEVILRSGSVQVSDVSSNELVILKPDQKYFWDRGRTEVSSVNSNDCCRWYERRLAFDNVRLGDILESLSHKYQMRITSNVGELGNKRLSLTVRNESVEEILDVLSTLLPLRWERQGRTIIIIDDKTNQTIVK